MPWLLLDLALVLLALLALAVVGLRLWRGVKALAREVAAAGEAVGTAADALARLQDEAARDAAARAADRPAVPPTSGVSPQVARTPAGRRSRA